MRSKDQIQPYPARISFWRPQDESEVTVTGSLIPERVTTEREIIRYLTHPEDKTFYLRCDVELDEKQPDPQALLTDGYVYKGVSFQIGEGDDERWISPNKFSILSSRET